MFKNNFERRTTMKANVIRGACISCGVCESLCPDVFKEIVKEIVVPVKPPKN